MMSIYTISHPITEAVVYVGKTNDIEYRSYTHLNGSHNQKLLKWVKSLEKENMTPIFTIIDTCEDEDATKTEKKWISHYKDMKSELFNISYFIEARKTYQFDISPSELQDIFNFGGDPERIGSKGRALRAVIERHKEQIHTINALHSQLKQLSK